MSDFNRTEPAKDWLAPGTAVAAAMLRQAEKWASAQGELLSGIEALSADWMKRQSAAIDAGSRSLQQMCECRNPADLVQLQQQWAAETMRRATSDFAGLANDALAVMRRAASADGVATPPRREEARRGTEVARPAEGKPVVQRAAE